MDSNNSATFPERTFFLDLNPDHSNSKELTKGDAATIGTKIAYYSQHLEYLEG